MTRSLKPNRLDWAGIFKLDTLVTATPPFYNRETVASAMSNNNYAQWLPYYATVIVNIQPSVLNTQQKEHLNSCSDDVPQRALEGESTGQLEKGIREGTRESSCSCLWKGFGAYLRGKTGFLIGREVSGDVRGWWDK